MANDKRIRDLTDPGTPPLISDFLPADRPGIPEAMRFTFAQIAALISPNVIKQKVYTGVSNPDNALGVNGDLFFLVPANGTSLTLYQKNGAFWGTPVWGIMFKQIIMKTGADVTDYAIDLTASGPMPNVGVTVYVNGVTGTSTPQYNEATKILSGLPDTVEGDTIKIILQ